MPEVTPASASVRPGARHDADFDGPPRHRRRVVSTAGPAPVRVEPATQEAAPARKGWRVYQALRLALRWLRRWVRLEARGLEAIPRRGPVLVVSNHDSWLDPLAIAEVMMWRERPVRFLAKDSLWKWRITAAILNSIGQIPIRRGAGDSAALDAAVAALRSGEAVAIFPEGTFSRGQALRARRGVARLAQACPEVPIVLVAVEGGTALNRLSARRPRISAEFFPPAGGPARADEPPAELAQRLLDEIRARVPPTV